jgi:LmbE family N-acetylglucosaminyl deacetylase
VTEIAGSGTSESAWATWGELPGLPILGLADAGTPLVVAPHPDDEVLGVGGLIAVLGRADIIAVTNGEASHPRSRVHTPEALARIRVQETIAAVAALGLSEESVMRLNQPDGAIDESSLTAALTAALTPRRWCLATWRGDGHPDHEAVGRAAAAACAATGARLLEYPIWMWHWARPADVRVPWPRARLVALPHVARDAKARAVSAFGSQITDLGPDPADAAILPPHILARFARPFEVLFA